MAEIQIRTIKKAPLQILRSGYQERVVSREAASAHQCAEAKRRDDIL
jgi:hypothetical protein